MSSSFITLEGSDLQDYVSAVRGQSDSILVFNGDDSVDGVDGDDRVVLGLGNDTVTIFTQPTAPGFSFGLNGAEIYGDGFPNSQLGGSVDDPIGNDSINISLPGRGPQVFTGVTSSLLDAGGGADTIYGWNNFIGSSAIGADGDDIITWERSTQPSRTPAGKVLEVGIARAARVSHY